MGIKLVLGPANDRTGIQCGHVDGGRDIGMVCWYAHPLPTHVPHTLYRPAELSQEPWNCHCFITPCSPLSYTRNLLSCHLRRNQVYSLDCTSLFLNWHLSTALQRQLHTLVPPTLLPLGHTLTLNSDHPSSH